MLFFHPLIFGLFSGMVSSSYMEISIVNNKVERRGSFEIRVGRLLPNVSDKNFSEMICGKMGKTNITIPLAKYAGSPIDAMVPVSNGLSSPFYTGRIKFPPGLIIRIENAQFEDEGMYYCELSFLDFHNKVNSILKKVQLKAVYGKLNISFAWLTKSTIYDVMIS